MIIDLLNVVFFEEFLLNASFLCVSAIEEGDKGGGGEGLDHVWRKIKRSFHNSRKTKT